MDLVKSFLTQKEAQSFLDGSTSTSNSTVSSSVASKPTKFYAVHKGRTPGVYTDWAKASNEIAGFKGPVHKAFKTREEALDFVKNGHPPKRELQESSRETPPAKKQKKDTDSSDELVEYTAGEGPLPPDAEDGFDPRITLNPVTGKIEYKNPTTKWQAVNLQDDKPVIIYTDGSALGNGANGAVAGVGVYFGPQDKRYGRSCPADRSYSLLTNLQQRVRASIWYPPNQSACRIDCTPTRSRNSSTQPTCKDIHRQQLQHQVCD